MQCVQAEVDDTANVMSEPARACFVRFGQTDRTVTTERDEIWAGPKRESLPVTDRALPDPAHGWFGLRRTVWTRSFSGRRPMTEALSVEQTRPRFPRA